MISTFCFSAILPSLDVWTSEHSAVGHGTTPKARPVPGDRGASDQPGERHERHQRVRPEIAVLSEAMYQPIPQSRARGPEMAAQEKHRGGPERDHCRLRARRAARTAARSGSRSAAGNSSPATRWRRTAPTGRSMTAKVICEIASRVARPKK